MPGSGPCCRIPSGSAAPTPRWCSSGWMRDRSSACGERPARSGRDFATIRNGVGMIIEPRVRGFICTTAHPVGCAQNVREQISYVLGKGAIPDSPKRVAVLGCSTGYGLASRIVATIGGGADTIGVSLEREPTATRTGSAGWYNNRAFEIEAKKISRSPLTLEGDALSDEMKKNFIDAVREKFGQLDLLVYSIAAPVRTDPD